MMNISIILDFISFIWSHIIWKCKSCYWGRGGKNAALELG